MHVNIYLFYFYREELVKSPFLKVLISTLVTLQESHEQVHVQSFQWMYLLLLLIYLMKDDFK